MIREVISTSDLWLARFALLFLLTRLSIWVGETEEIRFLQLFFIRCKQAFEKKTSKKSNDH